MTFSKSDRPYRPRYGLPPGTRVRVTAVYRRVHPTSRFSRGVVPYWSGVRNMIHVQFDGSKRGVRLDARMIEEDRPC